ncbi:hypothetical protein GCM10011578_063730 [Streptomyces fuscichromogenes]|uniref:Uncharacterized protein n=1 Tax=Streptomyces fuscichromogenes TaxID=1324013 RepID=A0A918CUG6_9ACTN|nr:hypothetical protein GCM10011578_063730 [Streptomyces fuscichromogenes]
MRRESLAKSLPGPEGRAGAPGVAAAAGASMENVMLPSLGRAAPRRQRASHRIRRGTASRLCGGYHHSQVADPGLWHRPGARCGLIRSTGHVRENSAGWW